MITLVLTNRNRDLLIVKNCLDSLNQQTHKDFKVFLIDYGSEINYLQLLKKLVSNYKFIDFIHCPVYNQLWSKCRAINIALKQTETPYFTVGDIDLIFHPEFIEKANLLASNNKITYFKYAFLTKEESKKIVAFNDYKIDFFGGDEVTGTTLFPTDILKSVNGYQEFYHGWGAEDTDVHLRLKNKGLDVIYYDSETLLKHQWHPKSYRSKSSTHPFHSDLERINQTFMNSSNARKITKVNISLGWGLLPNNQDYQKLNNKEDFKIEVKNSEIEIAALFAHFKDLKNANVLIKITSVDVKTKYKNTLKNVLGKKHETFYSLEKCNNLLLEEIIKNYRNLPYNYSYNRREGLIYLRILF